MSCVCIIPARGGSTRIPRKNIKDFLGMPIMAYSIEIAKDSGVFDEIFVSTDDNEIAEVAVQFGAKVIRRSAEMSRNEIGTQEVMRDVLTEIAKYESDNFIEYACCLYATAPMLKYETLVEAYRDLSSYDVEADYVVPLATWLNDPGQFYFGRSHAFIQGYPLIGRHTHFIKIDPATECDINTMEDWKKAEEMYLALEEENE